MNPKLKAKELVRRIFEAQHVDDRAKMICLSTVNIAIIAVGEILSELELQKFGVKHHPNIASVQFDFWQEVLTELKSMK